MRRPVKPYGGCNLSWVRALVVLELAGMTGGLVWGEPAKRALVLTDAGSIRALHEDEAAKAVPVHLRGVVTANSGWKNSFFFQDRSAGISVDPASAGIRVEAGDELEIRGFTKAGLFEPNVTATGVKVLGKGHLPVSKVFDFEHLRAGQQDSQWIEVGGVIRSASVMDLWGRRVLRLIIETGTGRVETRVQEFAGVDPEKLLDATVRARGVCGTNFNDKRQLIGVRLFVSGMKDVRVVRAALSDPFSSPVISISDVQRFGAGGEPAKRVRVRGAVTYQTLGRGLYLQDGTGGLRVNTTQNMIAKPGQEVEAVGFASVNDQTPALDDSQIRLLGAGGMPVIAHVSPEKMINVRPDGFFSTPYESLLVSVQGRLVDSSVEPEGATLALHEGGTLFRARLRAKRGSSLGLPRIENGSTVRVTGICSVFRDESGDPVSFLIKLRSPEDVAVVERPNWLTEKLLLCIAGLLLTGAAVVIVRHARQRMRIEQELARSQHRFQLFLDNSPVIAYIKDEAGRILWGNAAWKQIGFEHRSAWTGKKDSELWPEEAARQYREHDMAVHLCGRAMEFQETLPLEGGETRHFLSTKFPFQSEQGAPMLGGVSFEITERVQMEQKLQKSERQYRELFEKNPVPACVYCLESLAVLDVNQAAIDQYGYTREEFLSLTLRDIRMPEEVEAIERSFETGEGKDRPQGWRHRRKNGSVIHVQLISHTMELNSRRCRLVLANDITERLENEEKFRVVFEESSDAHLIIDGAEVKDCNQAAVTMLKASSKEVLMGVLSAEFSLGLEGEGRDYCKARKEQLAQLQDQGSIRLDCVNHRFDGSELEMEVSLTRVKVSGRPMVLEIWHDLTKRKEMEQRLSREALTDPLTGLANRRHFNRRLELALVAAKLEGTRLTLCVGDLDYFKQINDRYGHTEGDQVLMTIGRLLRDGVRQTDLVARIGGDEFCMLFPATSANEVEILLNRVQDRLRSVCFGLPGGVPFSVSATFGVAELRHSHRTATELFEAADQALYGAKELGRNRIGTVAERRA